MKLTNPDLARSEMYRKVDVHVMILCMQLFKVSNAVRCRKTVYLAEVSVTLDSLSQGSVYSRVIWNDTC